MAEGIGSLTQYIKSAIQLHPAVGGDQSVRPVANPEELGESVRLTISAAGRTLAGLGTDAPYQGPSDPLGVAQGRAAAQQTLAPLRQGGEVFQQNAQRLDRFTQQRIEQQSQARLEEAPASRDELTPERKSAGLVPPVPEAQPRERTRLISPPEPPPVETGTSFDAQRSDRGLLAPAVPFREGESEPPLIGAGERINRPPFAPRHPGEATTIPGALRAEAPANQEPPPSGLLEPRPQPDNSGADRTFPNASDMATARVSQTAALRTYAQVAGFGSSSDASQGTPFARVA